MGRLLNKHTYVVDSFPKIIDHREGEKHIEREREKRYGGVVHMDTSVIGHLGMGAHMALCPPKHGEDDEEEIWALP